MPVARARRRLPALRPRAGRAGRLDLRQPRPRPGTPRRDAERRPARRCSASPNIASKRWAFEQYDSIVGSRTVRRPERADAAVLAPRTRPARRSRSRSTATGAGSPATPTRGRSRRSSSARRTSPASGAEPLGLTNCLNFGNPEKPHGRLAARPLDPGAGRRLQRARRPGGRRQRLALQRDRARARSTRPRSSAWSASCPTPSAPAGLALREGDAIAIVGPFAPSLAGSELAKLRGELGPGLPALDDRARSRAAIAAVREAVRAGALARRPRHQRRRARLRARRDGDRRRGRRRGRPRPAGRGARMLGRDGAVRRGAGRLRARRRPRGSRPWPRAASTCSSSAGRRRADHDLGGGGRGRRRGRRRGARLALARRAHRERRSRLSRTGGDALRPARRR